jgi:type I restriction enzyme S subunit
MTPLKKIGEIAQIAGGSGFGPRFQGQAGFPIPFIKVSDFQSSSDGWLSCAANTVSEDTLKKIGAKKFPVGTIIFPKVGGALLTNKRARLGCEAAIDNNIMGVIPHEGYADYLYYFLLYFDMGRIANMGALPSVNAGNVALLELPALSGDEREGILNELKKQLSLAGRAISATLLQRSEVKNLENQIIFRSLVPEKKKVVKLGDALREISSGIGSGWAKFPVLGATRKGLAPAKELPGKNAHRYKPAFPGTVFYNPMRILIGSIAFVDEDDKPGITSPDYVALKGADGMVDSRWFYHWLRSPLGEQCISSLARGAVRERMLFNRLAEGEIELPDLSIQERASKALAAIKPMRVAIEMQIKELELMPHKLLAKIFEN